MVNSNLPLQLSPVIFVGNAVPGLDLLDRLQACYAALSLGPAPTQVTRGLLDVEAADAVKPMLPAASLGPLQRAADNLQATFQASWAPALGTVTNTEVSVLTAPQHNFERGTVVLTRTTDQITEQYVLPFVRVDLGAGKHEIVGLDGLDQVRPDGRQRAASISPARASGHDGTTKRVVGAILAQTPFLPPPFGPVATGKLHVVNLILDSANPRPPDPFADLKSDLETYSDRRELLDHGVAPLSGIYTELVNNVDLLQAAVSAGANSGDDSDIALPIDQMTILPPELLPVWVEIDGEHVEYSKDAPPAFFQGPQWTRNHDAAAFLWDDLARRDDTDYADALDVLIHAVTQQLLLAKLSIQCRALACSIHHREGDATAFDVQNRILRAQVAKIADSIGVDPKTGKVGAPWSANLDSLTAAQIQDGVNSDQWIPRIRAWWATVRNKRAGSDNVSGLLRMDQPLAQQSDPGPDGTLLTVGTWTWTDKRDNVSKNYRNYQYDNGAWNNRTADTDGPGCSWIQHKDVAEQARAAYIAKLKADLDRVAAEHLAALDAWATWAGALAGLLPPDAPQAR